MGSSYFIEKVFKQHPFVYKIGGNYYIFGTGVCRKCEDDIDALKREYDLFEENVEVELTRQEASRIFKKVIGIAEIRMDAEDKKDKERGKKIPRIFRDLFETLMSFGFNEGEMTELEKQIERYVAFWQKYDLEDYISAIR